MSFSLDLNEGTESLPRTVFGSEFQTAGAVQRKARFAIVVSVNGRFSVDVITGCVRPYSPGVGDGDRRKAP